MASLFLKQTVEYSCWSVFSPYFLKPQPLIHSGGIWYPVLECGAFKFTTLAWWL